MKKLIIAIPIKYKKDCERLQQVLRDNGYEATLKDCEKLWGLSSESLDMEWKTMADFNDEELFEEVDYLINQ